MTKVPAKLRITLKKQTIHLRDDKGGYIKGDDGRYMTDDSGPKLGFANVYEPNSKAYAKREETQNKWAYGHGCYDKNGQLWHKGYKYVWVNGKNDTQVVDEPIDQDVLPIVIDNTPSEGFRIQKSVSRSSTSNKVWRILDPRGFELEISSANMEDIMHGGVIDRGLIIGKCVWQTAKMLVRV